MSDFRYQIIAEMGRQITMIAAKQVLPNPEEKGKQGDEAIQTPNVPEKGTEAIGSSKYMGVYDERTNGNDSNCYVVCGR